MIQVIHASIPSAGGSTDAIVAEVAALSSATIHEVAGKLGALPSMLKPLASGTRLCGRALPVKSPAGDNLWLHHAIYQAAPGEVLVVDVGKSTLEIYKLPAVTGRP